MNEDPYDIRWHGGRLDPYRICVLYEVTHPALAHAVKKILCAGQRGQKGALQDVEEAIRALDRYVEMGEEDDDVVVPERADPPTAYRFRDADGNSVALSVKVPPHKETTPCSP